MKIALITGATGQDGFHLTEFLLSKKYKVIGMINGQRPDRSAEYRGRYPQVSLINGDLSDISSLIRVLEISKPDEIYNLGAISFVGLSFVQPELTANITGLGVLRLLEACRITGISDKVRVYQASSSEMFGKVLEVPQTESTGFHPRSPYGVAKTFAHYSCVNYREAYGMHVSCGILFNHEGEHRGSEFVTRKITQEVSKIGLGLSESITLGDISPQRDWGYAGDYVEAMWLMLQQDTPDDYVIATGKTHSVREFLMESFGIIGVEYNEAKYVNHDPKFSRPSEVDLLVGDPNKAFVKLGWKPKLNFQQLVEKMMVNDLALLIRKNNLNFSEVVLPENIKVKIKETLDA
jgi:GDPmannose 4,6-dehydratase